MKITLYSIPSCAQGQKIKEFLIKNNLLFEEIIVNNELARTEMKKLSWQDKISILKVVKSHSINIMHGFLEWDLNRLLEHINKYKLKS